MKKTKLIYPIGIAFAIYGIVAIKYSLTGGSPLPSIIAILSFIGCIGLFLRKPWSRYFIYLFTTATVPWWLIYTVRLIWTSGWPYYSTTLESIIGLLPGGLFCLFCTYSSWFVHKYFKEEIIEKT